MLSGGSSRCSTLANPPLAFGQHGNRLHSWTDFALCAAALDAILDNIAQEGTTHTALAPLMTPSAHPMAILKSPPHPTSYVYAVLATLGGSPAPSLPPPLALPSPTVNGQLRMECQRA
jgi:hypothetical protein